MSAPLTPSALAALLAILSAMMLSPACLALEVFIDTNSPAKASQGSQLFERDKWRDAAKAIDGIWYVGQGMTKPPEGGEIGKARHEWVKAFKDKQWIVELQGRVVEAAGARGKHGAAFEVKAMKAAGVEGFSAMVFREDRDKDSTLTAADVAAARAGMKAADVPDTPIIVNTRAFHRNHLLHELVEKNLVDGFSVEVASNHVREGKIIEAELVPAVQFAVKHQEGRLPADQCRALDALLEDVQDIYQRLARGAGAEMASPHVRFVLGAYSASKTQFTPDRNEQGRLRQHGHRGRPVAVPGGGPAAFACDRGRWPVSEPPRGRPATGGGREEVWKGVSLGGGV